MLRSLVLILLLVNLAFFSWSQGWLTTIVGVHPSLQREPHRLTQQHADKLVVLPPQSAAPAAPSAPSAPITASSPDALGAPEQAPAASPVALATPASAVTGPSLCLEAGPFRPVDMALVEANLQPVVPRESWATQSVPIQGLWFLYMGPYPDRDLFERKQAELKTFKGLSFEEVRNPSTLANGFVLGRFTQANEAQSGLEALKQRGIRTARIVNVRPRMDAQLVRVAQATAPMQTALHGIKLPQGKRFAACQPAQQAPANQRPQTPQPL